MYLKNVKISYQTRTILLYLILSNQVLQKWLATILPFQVHKSHFIASFLKLLNKLSEVVLDFLYMLTGTFCTSSVITNYKWLLFSINKQRFFLKKLSYNLKYISVPMQWSRSQARQGDGSVVVWFHEFICVQTLRFEQCVKLMLIPSTYYILMITGLNATVLLKYKSTLKLAT